MPQMEMNDKVIYFGGACHFDHTFASAITNVLHFKFSLPSVLHLPSSILSLPGSICMVFFFSVEVITQEVCILTVVFWTVKVAEFSSQ